MNDKTLELAQMHAETVYLNAFYTGIKDLVKKAENHKDNNGEPAPFSFINIEDVNALIIMVQRSNNLNYA